MTDLPPMDRRIRDEWTRRLRSGDHVQGVGALRRDVAGVPQYCCLGVLCEVAREAGVAVYDPVVGAYRSVADPASGDYNGVLPPPVARWAGLVTVPTSDRCDPTLAGRALSDRNDGNHGPRQTFAELADLIEEYL